MPDVLDAARALGPSIRAAADAIEAERRVPLPLVDAMTAAGVFRLCIPRALGGLEAEPATMLAVLEELASADGSAGWIAMIGATSAIVSAYLPDDVARLIYADGRPTGGVFAPHGRAVAAGDGYRVSGRWPFASGCQHCAWLMAGAVIVREGRPPDARLFFLPAADVRIEDTWHVAGLRGTGSHDIVVDDRPVRADRTVSIVTDTPRAGGPLYRFPVFGLLALGVSAVALGIARRALDELIALATAKTPVGSRRRVAERALVQMQVAEATAAVDAARALQRDAVGDAWTRAAGGDALTLQHRARLRLAATHATRAAAGAVDRLYEAGGGSAIYAASPLQRCFRDVHVVTQHLMVAPATYELTGRLLFGVPTDASQL
jgi:indole-3-acetate monooxygenase